MKCFLFYQSPRSWQNANKKLPGNQMGSLRFLSWHLNRNLISSDFSSYVEQYRRVLRFGWINTFRFDGTVLIKFLAMHKIFIELYWVLQGGARGGKVCYTWKWILNLWLRSNQTIINQWKLQSFVIDRNWKLEIGITNNNNSIN